LLLFAFKNFLKSRRKNAKLPISVEDAKEVANIFDIIRQKDVLIQVMRWFKTPETVRELPILLKIAFRSPFLNVFCATLKP